jgi:hypothetical protein
MLFYDTIERGLKLQLSPQSEISSDPRWQAVPSIRGTVYQAWWSIDAWLRLTDDNTVIYLEGAEDFDVVRKDGGAVAAQIRNTSQPISLGTQKRGRHWRFSGKSHAMSRIAAWTYIISHRAQPRWRWIQTLAESPASRHGASRAILLQS